MPFHRPGFWVTASASGLETDEKLSNIRFFDILGYVPLGAFLVAKRLDVCATVTCSSMFGDNGHLHHLQLQLDIIKKLAIWLWFEMRIPSQQQWQVNVSFGFPSQKISQSWCDEGFASWDGSFASQIMMVSPCPWLRHVQNCPSQVLDLPAGLVFLWV